MLHLQELTVTELNRSAGALLDTEGEGLGARLRFSVP